MSALGEPPPRSPRLGRYELITQIGQGGMAEVQLALQRGPAGFEKLVVVKLVHENLASQKAFVDMLLDEARVAALVKHPNVVDIYDLGEAEGRYFIAMEYLEGEPLLAVLRAGRDGRRLDVLSTARLIADTAEGLDAAHELRSMAGDAIELVHHDVSLGNIVVLYNGQVKLVDFGVAKASQSSTASTKIQGKFGYMAPEKLRGGPGDRRSDIWSLGCVLWEALTLQRLFKGGNDGETMRLVLEAEILAPSKVNADVPADFDAIALRALSRDPAKRYATAKAMATELEDVLRKHDYAAKNDAIARYMQATFERHIAARKKLLQEVSSKGGASQDVLEEAFQVGPLGTGRVPRASSPLPPVEREISEGVRDGSETKPLRGTESTDSEIEPVGGDTLLDGRGSAPAVDNPPLPFGSAASLGQAKLVDNPALPFGSAASLGQAKLVDKPSPRGGSKIVDNTAPALDALPGLTRLRAATELSRMSSLPRDVRGAPPAGVGERSAARPTPPPPAPAVSTSSARPVVSEPVAATQPSPRRVYAAVGAAALVAAGLIAVAVARTSTSATAPAPAAVSLAASEAKAPGERHLIAAGAGEREAAVVQPQTRASAPPKLAVNDAKPEAKPLPRLDAPPSDPPPIRPAPPEIELEEASNNRKASASRHAQPSRTAAKAVERPVTVATTEDPAEAFKAGLQAWVRGDTRTALAAYKRALQANPRYAAAWRGVGLVYEKLGDKPAARGAFQRYLQLSPGASDAAGIRARLEAP